MCVRSEKGTMEGPITLTDARVSVGGDGDRQVRLHECLTLSGDHSILGTKKREGGGGRGKK